MQSVKDASSDLIHLTPRVPPFSPREKRRRGERRRKEENRGEEEEERGEEGRGGGGKRGIVTQDWIHSGVMVWS